MKGQSEKVPTSWQHLSTFVIVARVQGSTRVFLKGTVIGWKSAVRHNIPNRLLTACLFPNKWAVACTFFGFSRLRKQAVHYTHLAFMLQNNCPNFSENLNVLVSNLGLFWSLDTGHCADIWPPEVAKAWGYSRTPWRTCLRHFWDLIGFPRAIKNFFYFSSTYIMPWTAWPSGTSAACKKGTTFLLAEVQGATCSSLLYSNWRPLLGSLVNLQQGQLMNQWRKC